MSKAASIQITLLSLFSCGNFITHSKCTNSIVSAVSVTFMKCCMFQQVLVAEIIHFLLSLPIWIPHTETILSRHNSARFRRGRFGNPSGFLDNQGEGFQIAETCWNLRVSAQKLYEKHTYSKVFGIYSFIVLVSANVVHAVALCSWGGNCNM